MSINSKHIETIKRPSLSLTDPGEEDTEEEDDDNGEEEDIGNEETSGEQPARSHIAEKKIYHILKDSPLQEDSMDDLDSMYPELPEETSDEPFEERQEHEHDDL